MEDIIEVNLLCKLNFFFSNLTTASDFVDQIKVAQEIDREQNGYLTSMNSAKKGMDDVIRYEGRLYLSKNEELRSKFLHKAHHSKYSIHPGVTNMCQDMKRTYW